MSKDNKENLKNEEEKNTNNEELNNKENKVEKKEQIENKVESKKEKNEEVKEETNKGAGKNENKVEMSKEDNKNTVKEENKENIKKFKPTKNEINTNSKQKSKNIKSKKEKKVKEKKSGKGIFTRVVAIIVILLVIIGLIYLAIPTPEKTVNNMFESLKEGNVEQTNQYVEYDKISLVKQLEKEESTEINVDEKSLFEALEWKIKSINTEGEIATVEVDVTNKDYEVAFKNYIQEMFKKFLNNEDITDQEQFELLLNEVKKEDLGTKTTTQTINLIKENGRWRVTADDNLTNALYPGLEDGINSISNILIN